MCNISDKLYAHPFITFLTTCVLIRVFVTDVGPRQTDTKLSPVATTLRQERYSDLINFRNCNVLLHSSCFSVEANTQHILMFLYFIKIIVTRLVSLDVSASVHMVFNQITLAVIFPSADGITYIFVPCDSWHYSDTLLWWGFDTVAHGSDNSLSQRHFTGTLVVVLGDTELLIHCISDCCFEMIHSGCYLMLFWTAGSQYPWLLFQVIKGC